MTTSDAAAENKDSKSPENKGSKSPENWEQKVRDRLSNGELTLACEKDAAYAAWMRAHAERKSKQLGVLSIPTAAGALIAGFVALDQEGSALSIIGLFTVTALAITLTFLTFGDRTIEATLAAAAVHEHRASGCCTEVADSPKGDESAADSDQSDPNGKTGKV